MSHTGDEVVVTFYAPTRSLVHSECGVLFQMAAFFSRPASAAVKIVAPPRLDGSPAPQPVQDQNRKSLPFLARRTHIHGHQNSNYVATMQNLGPHILTHIPTMTDGTKVLVSLKVLAAYSTTLRYDFS